MTDEARVSFLSPSPGDRQQPRQSSSSAKLRRIDPASRVALDPRNPNLDICDLAPKHAAHVLLTFAGFNYRGSVH
jgi:hypothetical protein